MTSDEDRKTHLHIVNRENNIDVALILWPTELCKLLCVTNALDHLATQPQMQMRVTCHSRLPAINIHQVILEILNNVNMKLGLPDFYIKEISDD